MAKQYVQHSSGQGAKWEVHEGYSGDADWRVWAQPPTTFHWLPKSDYVLCPPPERWVDVTAECEVTERGWIVHKDRCTSRENGYRRSKALFEVGQPPKRRWAIIIEQKVSD